MVKYTKLYFTQIFVAIFPTIIRVSDIFTKNQITLSELVRCYSCYRCQAVLTSSRSFFQILPLRQNCCSITKLFTLSRKNKHFHVVSNYLLKKLKTLVKVIQPFLLLIGRSAFSLSVKIYFQIIKLTLLQLMD